MKAWVVRDKDCESYAVVFAETRGKAKQRARRWSDYGLDEYDWTDVEAYRVPALDEHYNGKDALDWGNMADRVLMVRYCDMFCSYEVDRTDCDNCDAKEWCERYERDHEI